MFKNTTKEMLGLHSPDNKTNGNDMSDFGSDNCGADTISGMNTDGIGSGNESASGAESGIGDGCGSANGSDAGMSM